LYLPKLKQSNTSGYVCRRELKATFSALDSIVDGDGARREAQRRAALLGSSLRLTSEEDLLVEVLLERDDAPVDLIPNPFDPHLVDTSQILKPRTVPSLAGTGDKTSSCKHVGTSLDGAALEVDGAESPFVADLPLSRHTVGCASEAIEAQQHKQPGISPSRANIGEAEGVGEAQRAHEQPAAVSEADVAVDATTETEEGDGVWRNIGGSRETVRSLAEIDARLMDLALDHTWDEQCSLADFSGHGSAATQSLRTSIASSIRRMSIAGPPSTASVFESTDGREAGINSETESVMSSCGASTATLGMLSSTATVRGKHRRGGLRQLPAIPERRAVSADGSSAKRSESCSAAGMTEAQSQHSRRSSKHDKNDFLRPMREHRELNKLCATTCHFRSALLFMDTYREVALFSVVLGYVGMLC
jgi:hypothetical protein